MGILFLSDTKFQEKRSQRSCRVRQQVDFGSANAPKSLRLPHRHKVPRKSLRLHQDSGIYTDTDKKPAVLRDFSCIDFGMGKNHPFLRHNILYNASFSIVKKLDSLFILDIFLLIVLIRGKKWKLCHMFITV